MERFFSGKLVCKHVPGNRALHCYVEKKISEWIEKNRGDDSERFQYEVEFARDGDGHNIECHARIRSLSGEWNAYDWGASPYESLTRCLNTLVTR
jgi:hypothetical protein